MRTLYGEIINNPESKGAFRYAGTPIAAIRKQEGIRKIAQAIGAREIPEAQIRGTGKWATGRIHQQSTKDS